MLRHFIVGIIVGVICGLLALPQEVEEPPPTICPEYDFDIVEYELRGNSLKDAIVHEKKCED